MNIFLMDVALIASFLAAFLAEFLIAFAAIFDQVLDWYREPLFLLFPIAANCIAFGAFLLMAAPLTALRVWNPPWLKPYVIQPRKPTTAYGRLIGMSVRRLFLNFGILIVMSVLSWPALRLTGIHAGPWPAWYVIVLQVLFFAILDDFLYYWVHRAMHLNGFLYRKIHTVHHRVTTSVAISGNYMHPLEFLMISTMILIGPVLLSAHIVTVWVWVVVRQWEAAEQHSGLQFPFNPMHLLPFYDGPIFHDFHHSKFYGNYAGLFSWTDTVFGTRSKRYDEYLKTRAVEATEIEPEPRSGE